MSESPLRVLQVFSIMDRAGSETLMMNIFRHIDRTKVIFDFLVMREEKGDYDDEIESLSGKIHRIPYVSKVGPLGYERALDRFFREHPEYKIVHSHLDQMSGVVLKYACRHGVPVRIAHSHNTREDGGKLKKLYKRYAGRMIAKYANRFYACSEMAAEWLFPNAAEKAQILVNGIDPEAYGFDAGIREQVREELQIGRGTLAVGHVGRLANQKNHDFLLDIFAEIKQRKSDSVLLLAGNGPLKAAIENKAVRLSLRDSIFFLGVRDDVSRLMQAFDVFVFPSFFEGLGIVLIEAQAAGLPCVVSDAVPRVTDIGAGLMEYVSLGRSAAEWADEALQSAGAPRLAQAEAVRAGGYDIRESADFIEKEYLRFAECSS